MKINNLKNEQFEFLVWIHESTSLGNIVLLDGYYEIVDIVIISKIYLGEQTKVLNDIRGWFLQTYLDTK